MIASPIRIHVGELADGIVGFPEEGTDLQQAMQIQSEFLKSQFTNAAQKMQQITSEIMPSAKDASKG
jgi:hypothetical protein